MGEPMAITPGPGAGLWFVTDEGQDRPRRAFRMDVRGWGEPLGGIESRDLQIAAALLRHALSEVEQKL